MFKKKSLQSEVADYRTLVYDFRRRIEPLFENYRAINYYLPETFDFKRIEQKNSTKLANLFVNEGFDEANINYLINSIILEAKKAIIDLEKQSISHRDFYSRYENRRITDLHYFEYLLKSIEDMIKKTQQEYQHLLVLQQKYNKKEI